MRRWAWEGMRGCDASLCRLWTAGHEESCPAVVRKHASETHGGQDQNKYRTTHFLNVAEDTWPARHQKSHHGRDDHDYPLSSATTRQGFVTRRAKVL